MLKSGRDDLRDDSHATTRLNFDLGDVLQQAYEAHTSPAMIVTLARLLVDYYHYLECGL